MSVTLQLKYFTNYKDSDYFNLPNLQLINKY